MSETQTKEILLILKGNRKIRVGNIPVNAKITYSPVTPGGKYGDYAVRIYTAGNNQLAVFTNVESFRDLSLSVMEQKRVDDSSQLVEDGPKGTKANTTRETTYEWVDARP